MILEKLSLLKQADVFFGNRVKAKIVKNKVAAPFKEAFFEIHFDQGICRSADVLDMAVQQEVVQKAGAWFSYENEKIGQGKENTRKFLANDLKLLNKIEKQIISNIKNKK